MTDSLLFWAAIAATILSVGCTIAYYTVDSADLEDLAGGTGFLLGIVAIIAWAILGTNAAILTYQHRACDRYAKDAGMPIEWRQYTFWNYDCYAYADGKWVPTSQVTIIIQDRTILGATP